MIPKKKALFIVNPISGTRGKGHIIDEIESFINKDKFEYEINVTSFAGQAGEMSRKADADGVDVVVAVGGDGTVNEVAGGLVDSHAALGVIACGSGNGLARHLKLPLIPRKAIEVINNCEIDNLDYATVNGRPFFVTCGMGFDAYISYKFAEAGKRGMITYVENILNEWLRYEPQTYLLEDENGSKTYKAFLITCANCSEYGNNAFIAPQASMHDGLLDITIIEPFRAIEAPTLALQLFAKTLHEGERVKMIKSDRFTVYRQKEGVIHIDGDPIEAEKELHFKVVKGGINVIVNPEAQNNRSNLLQNIASFASELTERSGQIIEKPANVIRGLKKK